MATSLDSVQVVPHGLCGDADVGGHPQVPHDVICSVFPQCLGMSGDVAVFPGCGHFDRTLSRPVPDLAGGVGSAVATSK